MPTYSGDTRITCLDCAQLTDGMACRAAIRRERVDVAREYHPVADLPMHCAHFMPKPGDPDQRPGKERFPGAWRDYVGAWGHEPTPAERIKALREQLEQT